MRSSAAWLAAMGIAIGVVAFAVVAPRASGAVAGPLPDSTRSHQVSVGTVRIVRIPAPSVHGQRTIRIYTPPSYDTPEGAGRRYPVVYLLHGWPGSDGNLFQLGKAAQSADTLIAEGRMPETILVCPNGAGPGLLGRSYWINGADTTRRLEDFVVEDLVGWVDAHYRTVDSASFRAIDGISDGGLGAVNLAFRHPDVFGACGAHSADFVLERTFSTRGILGSGAEAERLIEANSPERYVDKVASRVRGLVIYLDCGVSDESLASTRRFHEQLTALGIPHHYAEFPGSHTWDYWRTHLRSSLVTLTARMSTRAP